VAEVVVGVRVGVEGVKTVVEVCPEEGVEEVVEGVIRPQVDRLLT
jgi:hypothetical protein